MESSNAGLPTSRLWDPLHTGSRITYTDIPYTEALGPLIYSLCYLLHWDPLHTVSRILYTGIPRISALGFPVSGSHTYSLQDSLYRDPLHTASRITYIGINYKQSTESLNPGSGIPYIWTPLHASFGVPYIGIPYVHAPGSPIYQDSIHAVSRITKSRLWDPLHLDHFHISSGDPTH